MPKIREAAEVRLSLSEARALLIVANDILSDGDNGLTSATTRAATRALQRVVEVFGGKWEMRAGAVTSNLFD